MLETGVEIVVVYNQIRTAQIEHRVAFFLLQRGYGMIKLLQFLRFDVVWVSNSTVTPAFVRTKLTCFVLACLVENFMRGSTTAYSYAARYDQALGMATLRMFMTTGLDDHRLTPQFHQYLT